MSVALSLALGLAASLRAATATADTPHTHVQLIVPAATLVRGHSTQAGLYFKLEPGWHVYWKNAGDSGLPPRVKWTLPNGISAGPIEFPAPQRLPLGPLMDFGYDNEVLFPLTLTVSPTAATGPATLIARLDWLVCREQCVPGKAELAVTRPVSATAGAGPVGPDAALFDRLAARVPSPLPASFKARAAYVAGGFRLTLVTGRRETQAAFFPAAGGVISNPAAQKVNSTANGVILDLVRDQDATSAPSALSGVIELSGGRAYDLTATLAGAPPPTEARAPAPAANPASSPHSNPENNPESNPAQAAAQPAPGHGGGLELLRTMALAFAGGLILNLMPCVFPVLFLKGLALVQSGSAERHKLRAHGFVYAAGIVVSFWALVTALLLLRAAGSRLGWGFQFQSPVFVSLIACLLFFLGLSLAGQFEIGLSLTSAGGQLAAREGYTGSFFTGVLAVIVATPCTAPLMGAAIGYALAQPAAVTFSIFTALALGLAAPYMALTMQPSWTRLLPRPGAWMQVLRQAISVPIFATVIWLAWVVSDTYGALMLAALLTAFLLLAVAGWFLGRWPAQRWSTATALALAAAVLGLSLWSAHSLVAAPRSADTQTAHTGWGSWSPGAVARYPAPGRPVFVDFTASWCLSCQVNERLALSKPEVQKAFRDANVALLRADWTQRDESIARALEQLGRNGVPAYALYAPGQRTPQLLPEVLTPGIVTSALNSLPPADARTASLPPLQK